MKNVDLIIQGGTLCTMNLKRDILQDQVIVIDQSKIVEILDPKTAATKYQAKTTINAENCIVMPGLINTHTHSPMTYLRGISDDAHLMDWLKKYIWPLEAKFVHPDFVTSGTELAISEMLLSGTTTFNDCYFFSREIASAAKKAGIRCIAGEGLLDFPTPTHKTPDDALRYAEENLQEWKNDDLISASIAPHSLYTCSQNVIEKAFKLAAKYNALVHIHMSESETEIADSKRLHGLTPFGVLQRWGNLNQKIIAAHCVHLSEEDIDLLAEHKIGVAHNPESNLKLGNGVAPVSTYIQRGIPVGLGTDGAASNNDLNLLTEVDFAAKLQKGFFKDTTLMNSQQAVEMLTIEGARSLGLDHKVGSIEAGKQADIILLDLKNPHMSPIYNPYSHIVYTTNGSEVKTVVINGKVVVRDREITTLDMERVYREAKSYSDQIKQFLKNQNDKS